MDEESTSHELKDVLATGDGNLDSSGSSPAQHFSRYPLRSYSRLRTGPLSSAPYNLENRRRRKSGQAGTSSQHSSEVAGGISSGLSESVSGYSGVDSHHTASGSSGSLSSAVGLHDAASSAGGSHYADLEDTAFEEASDVSQGLVSQPDKSNNSNQVNVQMDFNYPAVNNMNPLQFNNVQFQNNENDIDDSDDNEVIVQLNVNNSAVNNLNPWVLNHELQINDNNPDDSNDNYEVNVEVILDNPAAVNGNNWQFIHVVGPHDDDNPDDSDDNTEANGQVNDVNINLGGINHVQELNNDDDDGHHNPANILANAQNHLPHLAALNANLLNHLQNLAANLEHLFDAEYFDDLEEELDVFPGQKKIQVISRLPIRVYFSEDECLEKCEQVLQENNESEKKCSICLADYMSGQELKMLPCFHEFHQSCLDTWLLIKLLCPKCRLDVDLKI